MMHQFALFPDPAQPRRFHWIADELYACIVHLRKAGFAISCEGKHVVVSGRRLSVREFRRAYSWESIASNG